MNERLKPLPAEEQIRDCFDQTKRRLNTREALGLFLQAKAQGPDAEAAFWEIMNDQNSWLAQCFFSEIQRSQWAKAKPLAIDID